MKKTKIFIATLCLLFAVTTIVLPTLALADPQAQQPAPPPPPPPIDWIAIAIALMRLI
jgi:hypothetical protein